MHELQKRKFKGIFRIKWKPCPEKMQCSMFVVLLFHQCRQSHTQRTECCRKTILIQAFTKYAWYWPNFDKTVFFCFLCLFVVFSLVEYSLSSIFSLVWFQDIDNENSMFGICSAPFEQLNPKSSHAFSSLSLPLMQFIHILIFILTDAPPSLALIIVSDSRADWSKLEIGNFQMRQHL